MTANLGPNIESSTEENTDINKSVSVAENSLSKKIEFTIDLNKVKFVYANKLKDLAKKIKINGFRPGKVPINVVENSHGQNLMSDIIKEDVDAAFNKKVKELDFSVASFINIKRLSNKDNLGIFEAYIEIFPKFQVPDLTTAEINKAVYLDSEDTNEILENIRIMYADMSPSKDPAGKYNVISFEAECTILDEKLNFIPNSELLNSKYFIKDLNKDSYWYKLLLAKNISDEIEFSNKVAHGEIGVIPKYWGKDYKGKLIIKDIMHLKLPEITEEFVTKLGAKDIEEFKNHSSNQLVNQSSDWLTRINRNRVSAVLYKLIKIDEFPLTLLSRHKKYIKERFNKLDLTDDEIIDNVARMSLHWTIIVDYFAKSNNINITNKEIFEEITRLSSNYADSKAYIEGIVKDQNILRAISKSLVDNKVVNYFLEYIKITDEFISFKEMAKLSEVLKIYGI